MSNFNQLGAHPIGPSPPLFTHHSLVVATDDADASAITTTTATRSLGSEAGAQSLD